MVGSLPTDVLTRATPSSRPGTTASTTAPPTILRRQLRAGKVSSRRSPVNDGRYSRSSGVELSPYNNMLYVARDDEHQRQQRTRGELLEFDPLTGQQVAIISLPDDPADNFFYYPYGFAIAPDGTFWIAQPNSQNIIHVDASGNLIASYSAGGTLPESASVRADGKVYFSGLSAPAATAIYMLDPSSGQRPRFFASTPTSHDHRSPQRRRHLGAATSSTAPSRYDDGNLRRAERLTSARSRPRTIAPRPTSGRPTGTTGSCSGSTRLATTSSASRLQVRSASTVWGVDNPNTPPQDTQDYYKFDLTGGQSATIVAKSLNGKSRPDHAGGRQRQRAGDRRGRLDATSPEHRELRRRRRPAPTTSRSPAIRACKYSLTVTRSANFDIEPNNTIDRPRTWTGTNGVLGAVKPGGTITVGQNFDGIDFNGSNCGCLPPDTNAAVGPAYVMETVNVQIRMFDKATGAIVDDQPLASFFGASSGGDPYVVYDDTSGHWFVSAFDSSDSGLFLKVSNDANPLDGWGPTFDLTNVGGFPDYQKMGFNKDAIFIGYNDFGSGGGAATIVAINKADAIAGVLTTNIIHPDFFQFRAMPPAQMHGDTTGGDEWFVSRRGLRRQHDAGDRADELLQQHPEHPHHQSCL